MKKINEKHLTYYSADAALASPNFQRTGQRLKALWHSNSTDREHCTRNTNRVNRGHCPAGGTGAEAQTHRDFIRFQKRVKWGETTSRERFHYALPRLLFFFQFFG